MSEESIEDRIKRVLTREAMVNVKPETIENETLLIDDLGLDSIQMVELIGGLEEEFDIILEDEELGLELFQHVNSLAHYIKRKLGDKTSGT